MARAVLTTMWTFMTLSFLASAAQAASGPAINDTAIFSGTAIIKGQNTIVSAELRLLQFDASKDVFLKRSTWSLSEQTDSQDEWVESKQILSADVAKGIVESCADFGGKPELITVPAGQFQSCRMDSEDETSIGQAWIAAVPFGIVRAISHSKDASVHTDLVLQAFALGN
jgi:hypothetical protein